MTTKTIPEVLSDYNNLCLRCDELYETEARLKNEFCQAEKKLCSALKAYTEENDLDLKTMLKKEYVSKVSDENKSKDVYLSFLMDFVGNLKAYDKNRLSLLLSLISFYQGRVNELEQQANRRLPSIAEVDEKKMG